MKRRRLKTPSAILTADWHIRADQPISRTDDYVEAMKNKVAFVFELSDIHDAPILIAGDLGHRPSWSNHLLSWFIRIIPDTCPLVIPGQHDMRNHRVEEIENYGLGVLSEAMAIQTYPADLGEINKFDMYISGRTIGMTHQFVWSGESDDHWPGQEAGTGIDLLKNNPDFDLVLSGDNHKPFVVEYSGRLLVNPGSLMRMTAKQVNHRPRVYLYYAGDNTVEPVYLPIEKDVINRDHIDLKHNRESNLQAFVERAKNQEDLSLSFEDNLKGYFDKNRAPKKVKEMVWEALS